MALIITAIVLLILAGIAITQLQNSGLFENTKLAKEKYENAQKDEKAKITKYSNEMDSYIGANRDYVPISYSLDEQDTGLKWLNGETIYQKTCIVDQTKNDASISNARYSFTYDLLNNVDVLIDINGFINIQNYGATNNANFKFYIGSTSAWAKTTSNITIQQTSGAIVQNNTVKYVWTVDEEFFRGSASTNGNFFSGNLTCYATILYTKTGKE